MRDFDGIESDFVYLSNSLFSLIYFQGSHEIPVGIEDWVSFV